MVRIGIFTGKTYYGVSDDPKECCICSTMRDLEATKDYAAKKKAENCENCLGCEESRGEIDKNSDKEVDDW